MASQRHFVSTHCQRLPEIAKHGGTNSFEYSAPNKLNLIYLLPHRTCFARSCYRWRIAFREICWKKKHGVGWPPKTMRNSSFGLHLKFSSWKASKVKNSRFCARFWEAWRVKTLSAMCFIINFDRFLQIYQARGCHRSFAGMYIVVLFSRVLCMPLMKKERHIFAEKFWSVGFFPRFVFAS